MDNNSTTIYYNPKCSKCRLSLELLQNNGQQPEVVEYLKDTPNKEELKEILSLLNISADQLLRKKESAYQASGLGNDSTENEILDAMMENPILIERPIILHNGKAVIGRPPEKILDIL